MPKSIDTPDSDESKIDELLVRLSNDLQGLNAKPDFNKAQKPQMINAPTNQEQYYYHFLRKNLELLEFIKSTPVNSIKERLSKLGLSDGILDTVIRLTKVALDSSGNSPSAHTFFSDKTGAMVINHQKIAKLLAQAQVS